MSAPDAPDPLRTASAPRILHGLLRNGHGRSAMLLGIFALVLFAAGRRAPDAAHASRVPHDPAPSAAGRAAEPRALPVDRAPASHLPGPTPEALAVDNLLARYDALIRLLEARSIGGQGPAPDSALAELRALRARTYAAARRAVAVSEHPPGR